MIRIDVERATQAIVKSANIGIGVFAFYVVFTVGGTLLTGGVEYLSEATDIILATLPMTLSVTIMIPIVYFFACVWRVIVVTELVAIGWSMLLGWIVGLFLLVLFPDWGADYDFRRDSFDIRTGLPPLLGLLSVFALGVPQIVAAHRFRALRRALRKGGLDLPFRGWRRASFKALFRAASRPRLAAGFAIVATGVFALWMVPIGTAAHAASHEVGAVIAIGFLVLSVVLLLVGHDLVRRAYRDAVPRLGEVLASDPRAPVLFLRSFRDDHMLARSLIKPPLWPLVRHRIGAEGSFEEALTIALTDIGPVITIGRPGETEKTIGAAREYLTHDNWQARVQELIDKAALVVILVNDSPGLTWEARRLLESDVRGRVLFLIPPSAADDREARWKRLRQQLEEAGADVADMPEPIGDALVVALGTAAKPGTRIYTSRQRAIEHYELAFTLASHERLHGALPAATLRRFFTAREA